MDRRTLLTRAGKVGLAAGLFPAILAACGGSDSSGDTPTTQAADTGSQPAATGATSAPSGGQITVGLQDLYHEFITPFLDEFTAQSGIAVELGSMPTSGSEMAALLTPQFTAGTAAFDVNITADEWFPQFVQAGWVESLADIATPEFLSDYPESVTSVIDVWMTKDGTIYCIPYGYSNGFYFNRQDVLDELGSSAPTSWDETIALGDAAKAKGYWVFADSVSSPDIAFVFISNLVAQSGGDVFAFDDGTRQAFEYTMELMDKGFFPKEALNWTYDQQNAAYINNQILTMRQWAFFYDVARAETAWFADDKAVITLPPSGPAKSAVWAGCQGWMVPAFTEKKAEAKEFVKFITSADVAARLAQANSGFVVPRTSTLEALGDTGIIPSLREYSDANVLVPRPFHPKTAQAQAVVDAAITGYLSGQQSLDEALETGRTEIANLG